MILALAFFGNVLAGAASTEDQNADTQSTEAPPPDSTATKAHRYILAHKPLAVATVGVLLIGVVALRIKKARAK